MRLRLPSLGRGVIAGVAALVLVVGPGAYSAAAASPLKRVCGAAGLASGAVGKVCSAASNGGRWVKASKKLLSGHVGGAAKAAFDTGVGAAATGATLAALGVSVLGGAKFALNETAVVLSDTSSPQLGSTWFSSAYWRVAGISVLLTLPFLFAAAVQALLRSDLVLLLRAAFGYLPLAMLAVSIAAPVTMLLLAASDQLSAVVSSATGSASNRFINFSAGSLAGITVAAGPFMAIFLGLLLIAGAVVLWIELLMREAAVYVIVLMLPLAFAGMVWPARRIWAIRAVELLVALVVSKFAIVAVLSLGGAALFSGASFAGHSVTTALAGAVLLIMGAFTPWALLRLLPLAEVASSAAGTLSRETRGRAHAGSDLAGLVAHSAPDWAADLTARMRDDASGAALPVPAIDASDAPPEAFAEPVADAPPEAFAEPVADASPKAPAEPVADASPEAPAEPGADAAPETPHEDQQVAPRAADEAPENLESVRYETWDVGIDEMWKPEHRGKWSPWTND
jgi:hypothetical protein